MSKLSTVERGLMDLLDQESSSSRNDTLPVGHEGRRAKLGSGKEQS